jgi:hypothetical protein
MLRQLFISSIFGFVTIYSSLIAINANAEGVISSKYTNLINAEGIISPSANNKYTNLIQELNCPSDRSKYGDFNDYGYWGGGPWCGKIGKAGYWIWIYPTWYIWQNKVPDSASVNGKYRTLIQELNCPRDKSKYGKFNDYGYWGGGPWCGKIGKAGYWVWDYPTWYVWETKNRK